MYCYRINATMISIEAYNSLNIYTFLSKNINKVNVIIKPKLMTLSK